MHLARKWLRPQPLAVLSLIFLSLLLLFAFFSYNSSVPKASASPFNTLNFQARIQTNNSNIVADGNYTVTFRLYNAQTGGSASWTETQSLTVRNGYFSAYLGSVTPFTSSIDWTQSQWLTLQINSDSEMNPRIKLTSVPYAFRSDRANRADQLQVTQGSNTGTLQFDSLSANRTVIIPDSDGTVCLTSGNCLGSGAGDVLQGGNQFGATMTLGTKDAYALRLIAGDNEAVRILTNGRVGIGTSAPGYLLDVSGGTGVMARFSGRVIGAPGVNSDEFVTKAQLDGVAGGGGSGVTALRGLVGALSLQGTTNAISVTDNGTDTITINVGSDVTVQGNTFNGANQLVRLNASAQLPEVSGALLTNLNAGNITDGTLADARLSTNVALLDRNNQTFTGNQQVFRNASDSTEALQVQNALGSALLTANTSQMRIGIGTSAPDYALDVVTSPSVISARFSGRVVGSDALNNNEFVTLSQLEGAVGGVGSGVTSVTNDTNVTGSITGNVLTLGWNGTLSVARGGTGTDSLTANRLLLGNGTGALQALGAGETGQCLLGVSGGAPVWGSCSAGGGITGTGTTGALARFTSSNTLGDSIMSESGSTITVSGTLSATSLQGNGSGITNINADNILTGTLNIDRIANLSITNAKLANSSLTVTAGNGLSGGGSVSLGGTTSLSIGQGDGITVGATTVGVDSSVVRTTRSISTGTGLTGGGDLSANRTISLANTAVTAGSYGSGSQVASFTVDAQGRLTSAASTNIAIDGSQVTTGTVADARLSSNVMLLDLVQTVTGAKTFNALQTFNNGLTLGSSSSFVTNRGADFTTNGSSNNVNLGTGSLYRLAGTASQTLTGITGGVDGRQITLINATASDAILANESASSTAANRITTGTGANINIPTGSAITLIYDSGASRWRVKGDIAGGVGSGVTSVTNDTNVTGSITGNVLTLGWNGTLSVARGGTGTDSLTANRLLLGNGTGALQALGAGETGQCLLGVSGGAPVWGSCSAGGGITGTGTTGALARFTSSNTLGDSIMSESGSTITVSGTLSATSLQGNGSGITNINADNILTGTLNIDRIANLSITNAKLANSSLTVTAGNGLSGGGSVSLGGTTSLSIGQGDGITVGATTVGVDSSVVRTTRSISTGTGLTGGGDLSANRTISLANTAVTAGSYGSGSQVASFTVDAQGRLTSAASTNIAIDGSQVTTGTVADARLSSNVMLLDLVQTVTGAKTFNALQTFNNGLTLGSSSSFVTNRGADFTTNGSSNNVNLGTGSLYRLAGTASQTLTGITGGVDGRQITLINATASDAILANESASSTAANRITTGTGANINIPTGSAITLIYDSGASRWRVKGDIAGGVGSGVTSVTNDTNVTGSITGNVLTLGWNGTLSVARGGTGTDSLTANRLLLGNGTGALQALGAGETGQCLLGVSGGAPVWGSCSAGGGITWAQVQLVL
jgi:trimeric autotransporter adhesin